MKRDCEVDFLRFLGLILVILAHVEAPFTIRQIRMFDVSLMVFVSGMVYSGKRIIHSWGGFYLPRIKRLIIPTWLFLAFYFVSFGIVGHPHNISIILHSFLLTTDNGLGYVWIIRVFLLITLMTPWLIKLNNLMQKEALFYLIVLTLIAACQFSVQIIPFFNGNQYIWAIYKEIVPYTIGYSTIFLIGLRVKSYSKEKETLNLILILLLAFMASMAFYLQHGLPIDLTPYKYPPQFFYLVYGILASCFLWRARSIYSVLSKKRIVLFIGQNTMWIYLWHIPFVIFSYKFLGIWWERYLFALLGALTVFSIQYYMANLFSSKFPNSCFTKYLKG